MPSFLLEDQVRRENGCSPALAVSTYQGGLLTLTLGITQILEQECLEVSVYGSPDGELWDPSPLAVFPQKFYCGTYTIEVDLTGRPDVRFVRVAWRMHRWEPHKPPLFRFSVQADMARRLALAAAG